MHHLQLISRVMLSRVFQGGLVPDFVKKKREKFVKGEEWRVN